VRLIQNEDFEPVSSWGKDCAFAQIASIVDAVVRSRVDFDDVKRAAAIAR
jgi:hypothetical protein